MALITRSDYGLVAVNNNVIKKLISLDMESMGELIHPCNRKGRLIRRGLLVGDPDLYNAISVSETRSEINVEIYYVIKFGESMNDISNQLFDMIEADFEKLRLPKPKMIKANIKGLMTKQVVPKDIEVVREND